jgi:hypothetical protein
VAESLNQRDLLRLIEIADPEVGLALAKDAGVGSAQ